MLFKSIFWPIGRDGPWKSRPFLAQMALVSKSKSKRNLKTCYFMCVSFDTDVFSFLYSLSDLYSCFEFYVIFRAYPIQWPSTSPSPSPALCKEQFRNQQLYWKACKIRLRYIKKYRKKYFFLSIPFCIKMAKSSGSNQKSRKALKMSAEPGMDLSR